MKRGFIVLGIVVGGLCVAELAARVYLFTKHPDRYASTSLITGSVRPPEAATSAQAEPTAGPRRPCQAVPTKLNLYGGRGPDWVREKPPGVMRITALGASTTYGDRSAVEATYPTFLEAALHRRYGRPFEVLNAGVPSRRIEQMIDRLPIEIYPFQPEMVLYYEGFNNAIVRSSPFWYTEISIARFHAHHPIGRLLSRLHHRSMFYTALLEKAHFEWARRPYNAVPEIAYFEAHLRRLVRLLRARAITPVFVLQVTQVPEEPTFRSLRFDDERAIDAAIRQAADAHARPEDAVADIRMTTIRGYQAQVLVEVVRRTGEALGVQIVDPRPAFSRYQGGEPLFCDVIHLTDRGNQLLAEAIAEALAVPGLRPQHVARTPTPTLVAAKATACEAGG